MALTKITSNVVKDDAVTSAKIVDGGIATADIANNAITSTKIAENSILTKHIDDGQVTTNQLGADAVTNAKIANQAIGPANLSNTIITDLTAVTAATGDLLMVADISDSNNLKKIPVSSILAGTHTGAINTSGTISSGAITTSGNISLTGGGTIEAPSVGGGESLILKAAGGITALIDSNSNSGDNQFFKVQKHANTDLFTVMETGNATFAGTISSGDINISNGYLKITNSGQGTGIELADINGNPSFKIVTDQQSPQNSAIVNNWGNSNNSGVLLGTSRSDGIALQVAKNITIDGTTGLPTDGGTRLFSVQGNGTVSINQPSPSSTYKLDVGGAIRSTGNAPSYTLREDDASSQTWLMASYGGNYAIRDTTVSGTTYPFQIEPATPSSTVYLDSTGNVGIGESSPDTTLHLKSAGATSIAIESTTNAQNLDLLFYNNAGSTQGYIRYAEGAGDFYFVPQNGGGATLKLDWTGFMTYGDEPSGDPPPNTASFRMNSSSTTGGPSSGNTYYPVVIGGGTHLAGRAFGIGLDPEGYGYRNKVGIVVEGDGAGYSKGDLHFLFNNSSDSQNAQISDAKFTFLREGYLGIGTRSPQRKVHIIGADGSSGITEGNSRSVLFLDNAGATYVNLASGNTSNGAIFFSDTNANNRGAVRYEHLTDSLAFDRGGTETFRLSGQTNVAYTGDGLFNSNARPHTWQCTTGGSFVLGYRDHGSGLYQGSMGLSYDNIDGLGNTAYRDAFVLKETSNGGQEHFRVSGNGNVTNTNNSYTGISDERVKTDIVDASSQWEDIKAVRVRKFKFGTAPEGHDFLQIGVISQELEASGMGGLIEESDPDDAQLAFNPELVGERVKTVKYSVLYMKAIKALQEAMTRIEALEARVTELE